MWVKLALVVVVLSVGVSCENKFRPQRAPADQSLPQPDRGPCAKQPAPVLFVRLPRFMRDDVREKRFCAPLDKFLKEEKLGTASKVAPPPRDDLGFSGCAVHAADVDRTLPELTRQLLKLKVPDRTVIEELCTGVGAVHVVR